MEILRDKTFWSVTFAGIAAVLLTGCVSTSLHRQSDWRAVVRPHPAVVAIGPLDDTVACDDEGIYLQDYIERRDLFLDVVLADPDRPKSYHSGNAVVVGDITPTEKRARRSGLGMFLSVITLGIYPVLGGPFQSQEMLVEYKFNVFYADTGVMKTYCYADSRTATYGLYKPLKMRDGKPDIYVPGWDALLYDICGEFRAQRAQGGEDSE